MGRKKKVMRTPKAARRAARKRRSGVSERRKKEFTYRGLSVEELKALPMFAPDDDPDASLSKPSCPLAHVAVCPRICSWYREWWIQHRRRAFINRLRENPGKTSRHIAVLSTST